MTASGHIHDKVMDLAKRQPAATGKAVSEIAHRSGVQYSPAYYATVQARGGLYADANGRRWAPVSIGGFLLPSSLFQAPAARKYRLMSAVSQFFCKFASEITFL